MTKVSDIFAKLNEHAPVELKIGFDNVGQLAGRSDRTVDRAVSYTHLDVYKRQERGRACEKTGNDDFRLRTYIML